MLLKGAEIARYLARPDPSRAEGRSPALSDERTKPGVPAGAMAARRPGDRRAPQPSARPSASTSIQVPPPAAER